jgi:hypothetical protein
MPLALVAQSLIDQAVVSMTGKGDHEATLAGIFGRTVGGLFIVGCVFQSRRVAATFVEGASPKRPDKATVAL